MKKITALLLGAAMGAGLAGNARGGNLELIRAQGDSFADSLAEASETLRPSKAAGAAGSLDESAPDIRVRCNSSEGVLHLEGNPVSGEFEFQLIKGDRHVEKAYSTAECPQGACRLQFSANRESGGIRVKGSKLLREFVAAHRACDHEPHGPTHCVNVPDRYEWNEAEGISIFVSPEGDAWLLNVYERGVDPKGDPHALGADAACSVRGL